MPTLKKAICIGMNYPNDPYNRLSGCVADAASMACVAINKLGIDSNNVCFMIDERFPPFSPHDSNHSISVNQNLSCTPTQIR